MFLAIDPKGLDGIYNSKKLSGCSIATIDGVKNEEADQLGNAKGNNTKDTTPIPNNKNNTFSPLKTIAFPSFKDILPKLAIIETMIYGNTVICKRPTKPSPITSKKETYSPKNKPTATPANNPMMIS